MSVQAHIEHKLTQGLEHIAHLAVENESHRHNVPPGSESHFKVVIVSDDFAGQGLLARHRRVNEILAEELQNQIHALALHTYTTADWQERHGDAPMSPPCLGGGKSSRA